MCLYASFKCILICFKLQSTVFVFPTVNHIISNYTCIWINIITSQDLICSFIQVLWFFFIQYFNFYNSNTRAIANNNSFYSYTRRSAMFCVHTLCCKQSQIHYKTMLNIKITFNVLKYLQILIFEPIMYMYILF